MSLWTEVDLSTSVQLQDGLGWFVLDLRAINWQLRYCYYCATAKHGGNRDHVYSLWSDPAGDRTLNLPVLGWTLYFRGRAICDQEQVSTAKRHLIHISSSGILKVTVFVMVYVGTLLRSSPKKPKEPMN